jgi:hypothetical protein
MRDEIETAIALHSEWTDRLRHAVASRDLTAGQGFILANVQAYDRCSFGKWLYGPTILAPARASGRYRRVRELHSDFHDAAATVVMLAVADNLDAAITALDGAFAQRTKDLVAALRAWQAES